MVLNRGEKRDLDFLTYRLGAQGAPCFWVLEVLEVLPVGQPVHTCRKHQVIIICQTQNNKDEQQEE